MKAMNKLILTLMCIASAFTAIWAADGDTFIQGDLKFTVASESDHTVMVEAATKEIGGDICIPPIVDNENSQYTVVNAYFKGCSYITSVSLPNTIKRIAGRSFYECVNLTSVDIPDSVVEIEDYAFYCCFSLTSVVIPNSVVSIGEGAFGYCGIEYAVLGNSVEHVDWDAFIGCSKLKKKAYPNTINNPFVKSHPDYGTKYIVAYDPNGTTIENGWIYGYNKSEIIFAPPTIEGNYVIPDSIESIGYYAFGACASLTSVEIGSSVKSISSAAFMDCGCLTSIDIPESLTSIENSVFCGCNKLTSITLPSSLTSIGDFAFLGCSGLTCIDLPNSVTSIGKQAFYDCSDLTSLTIPSFVTSIGDGAFYYCQNLTDIYYGAEYPVEFVSEDYPLFHSSIYLEATLWVPDKALEQCKQIQPWKYFNNIRAYDFGNSGSSIDDILSHTNKNGLKSVEVFDLRGVKVGDSTGALNSGIYIIRTENAIKKIVIR